MASLKTARHSLVVGLGTFVMVQEIFLADCLPILWLAAAAAVIAWLISMCLSVSPRKGLLAGIPSASRAASLRPAALPWSPQNQCMVLRLSGVNVVFSESAAHSFLVSEVCRNSRLPAEWQNVTRAWPQANRSLLWRCAQALSLSYFRLTPNVLR